MSDHYRTLGVAPDADEAVIRAAYLALMRRFHPDRAEGAQSARAKDITQAYAVLGDRARRADYDVERSRALWFEQGERAAAAMPRRRRWSRDFAMLAIVGTSGLVAYAMTLDPPAPPGRALPARTPVTAEAPPPREPAVRPLPPVAERIAEAAPLPVRTTPPAVEAAPPPPPLPLPRIAPRPEPAPNPVAAVRARAAAPQPAPAAAAAPAPRPARPASDLSDLDRHLMLLTNQSMRFADARRRTLLIDSGSAFASRLRKCADPACRRDLYLRRNQEIFEIMQR